jgi:hypothetical protein
MERNTQGATLAIEGTKTRMVQMTKIEKYLHHKSLMMEHLGFAYANQSMDDSLYHLICYHLHKDYTQGYYYFMTHEERKDLHTMMIL